ncbi:MAG: PEP-CTERM sorting domain-containing protein [Pedosphaera sp.]|nr:PEP-CTERM sorting domain-containing protein [Pedosphaera sp.]
MPIRFKTRRSALQAFAAIIRSLTAALIASSAFAQSASSVIGYQPGSGFATEFSSGAGYTNPAAALGLPSRETPGPFGGPIDPFNPPYLSSQLLSLGTGGALTLRLDQPLRDNPAHPFGVDFCIFGGAGFIITNGDYSGGGRTDGALFGGGDARTRVSVSQDGVHFYALNPSLAPDVENLFPTDGLGRFDKPVDPSFKGPDFSGQDLAGIRSRYRGSAGGTGYDLAWAQDADGKSIRLEEVSFIRLEVTSGHVEVDGLVGVSAVPEPSVWGLLIIGCGSFLGVTRWRGRLGRGDPEGGASLGRRIAPRMDNMRRLGLCARLWLVWLLISVVPLRATVIEDFSTDPFARGWQRVGEGDLFGWDASGERLRVTWDSSRSNSACIIPLGTSLARTDDFQFSVDLTLEDIAIGLNEDQPYTFQLAIGWISLADFSRGDFRRGTGQDAWNVVEFDYFPDSGFGPTISPVALSMNRQWFWQPMTIGVTLEKGRLYRIRMAFDGQQQEIQTQLAVDGQPGPEVKTVRAPAGFTDFRLDAFAILSYSDAGADGSIRARGVLDHLVLQYPEAPRPVLHWARGAVGSVLRCEGRKGWNFRLLRSGDLRNWEAFEPVFGTEPVVEWRDLEKAGEAVQFFRVETVRL